MQATYTLYRNGLEVVLQVHTPRAAEVLQRERPPAPTPLGPLQVLRSFTGPCAQGRALGSVVVINVGYNDWAAVYDVDRVMRALKAAGIQHVVWVTLREAGSNASIYRQSNARIRSAGKRYEAAPPPSGKQTGGRL